ncbi:hypothetical protein HYR99_00480 [Candidatus Poribacteria bacterium]|nr:hypothetical protein [Candidatus Poribacteria bacterium]
MSVHRKQSEKLRYRLWFNTARKERPILLERINAVLPNGCHLSVESFDDLEQLMDNGHQFWERVKSLKEREFQTIDECWRELDRAFRMQSSVPLPEREAIWFHPESDQVGAIRLKWSLVMKYRSALRELRWDVPLGLKQHTVSGGDFLVMSVDGKWGICLEAEEYGYFLRFWKEIL